VSSLDELDTDAVVVAVPPEEASRLLDESWSFEPSPIVSVHLLVDRPIIGRDAALLGSPLHWLFDRGRITEREPKHGQYLTVISSGVPELMELRGRDLLDLVARELQSRFGKIEVLWSRVSREPEATIALRPGVTRPQPGLIRDGVALAGAWTDTGWPATMEGAIRSGRTAALALMSSVSTKVAA
jgi:hypothetical protein